MVARSIAAVSLVALVVAACAPQQSPTEAEGTWDGTITTEGDVTTVVNESGSVWGGPARLVEEASIGVESGGDAYMFGRVSAVWAGEDRIFVVDWQVPAVRVHDFDGAHLFDLGRQGQGPGEFVLPVDVAVTGDGDILMIERNVRMNVFAADGSPKATWSAGRALEVGFGAVIALDREGVPWLPFFDADTRRVGRIRYGPEGLHDEPSFPPAAEMGAESEPDEEEGARDCLTYLRDGSRRSYCDLPFRPQRTTAFTPAREWVVGSSDAYRFEVYAPNGSVRAIERFWEPVAVSAAEIAYHERRITDYIRERADGSWQWNGPPIATHKPAWVRIIAGRRGRTWLMRERPSREVSDCGADIPTCWVPEGYDLDAFDADGRYLGSTTFLDDLRDVTLGALDGAPTAPIFIDGDAIVAAVSDAAGTVRVKRYRLVLPQIRASCLRNGPDQSRRRWSAVTSVAPASDEVATMMRSAGS